MNLELYHDLPTDRDIVQKIQTDAQLQLISHLLHRNDDTPIKITVNEDYLKTLAGLIKKHGPYLTKRI